ncbi:MAG: hypothetical protein FJ207_12490 [Gemmatimonadetes bacterium]|nr:hypothetical protein [Gemmatimonadota bacterium]
MLLPFFEWCEATTLGRVVRESLWMFPVIEAIHLVGLCVLGGSLLVVDFRLLGTGLKDSTIADLDRQARPWMLLGVAVMLSTGVPLFLSEAIKCYYNTAFWVKILTLPVALLFTLLVKERFARTATETSTSSRWVGATDLLLWFVVAAGGRWIGFS